ncbi:MAG: hypothetical protein GY775_05215 [Candidatus Scalindua sp.]|nr:hypothetical protein [Candidatus Scalindua sp.]
MPESAITFIKGDSYGSETDFRDALPVNMHGVLKPNFGAQGYMIQASGLTLFANSGTPNISRGGVWNDRFKRHYRVQGNDFIEVYGDGTVNILGSVSGSDTVTLDYSFETQGIVADGRFYLYDPSNGFREVTDPNLGSPIDNVWVDGYYFFTDGERLYHTEIVNGVPVEDSIDSADEAVALFMPDDSLGLGKTQDNKVIVFGRYSTEYYVNDASVNFSFARVQSRATKSGIVGTHAKCESAGTWFIFGGSKDEAISIHALGVGSTTKVATREVEKIIGEYTEVELKNVVLEAYEEDGYHFIVVHLPNETLKFNRTLAEKVGIEQAWSILKTDVVGDREWRAKFGVFDVNLGQWVFGDKINGNIGILDNTVATQYDEIVEWLLFTPYAYLERGSIDEFEVETIAGFTGSSDATVFLSLTYNGITYGKEWTEMYGLPSDYGKRFIIRRLGYVADFVAFKMRGATRSRMAFARGFIKYG